MDPVLRAALTSWDLRIEVIMVLALAGAFYSLGWLRLRKRAKYAGELGRWQASARWRPIAYLSGLFLLGIALMSPIDVLASQLFTMHMVQHVMLMMIIPPLLLVANPLPFMLWGLPQKARLKTGSLLNGRSRFRAFLRRTTGPGIVWLIFVIVYWGWHDPNAYNLALQNAFVHDIEHITFFGVSLLYWWHIIGAGPRIHRSLSPLARGGYALAAIPPNMVAGMAIVFATGSIYTFYEAMPRLWGLSVIQDQRIAGVIMWVFGSMMFIMATLILVGRWLQIEEKKPPLPLSTWATEEALAAPGIKK